MFELPIPAVVSVAFANLLMAGVFGVLYVRERSPGLSSFALAWMLEATRHFLSIAPVNVLTFVAGGITFCAAALTLVEGSFLFASRRPSWTIRVVVVALFAWQMFVYFWGPDFVVWHLPVSLFAAGMRLVVARMLWAAGGPWLGRGIATFAMALWGLHALSYPFLANDPSAAPWGFALSALLGLITALGVVMAYFDRSRAEADSSEARMRSIFESASDGIATLDDKGHVLTANVALARLLGFTRPSELEGMELGALVGREHAFADATRRGVETWRGPDGTARRVSVSLSKVRSGDHLDRIDVFVRDVTQETRLEAELEERRRLEALGRLAGGIAHDFNNLLQVVSGAAELAMRPGDPEQRAQHLGIALDASARGAELTRQLLAFGRRQTSTPQNVDVGELLQEFSGWVARLLGDHVRLELDLAAGAHVVSADRSQLEQILVNLVTNARDAMPDGGRVRVAVRRDADGRVCLEVEDEGMGMDDATRARIFEPFFTTKEGGRGTGLGLATVHGIAAQHGWSLSVETAPARGTRFSIRIPPGARESAPASAQASGEAVPRPGRVLVVDDDSEIRALVTSLLVKAGYEVRAMVPGPEATELASEPGWDALITDVEMPGTSGPELARAAREARPELGVVLMSGRADDGVALGAGSVFLPKPFRIDDLVRAVESVRGARR